MLVGLITCSLSTLAQEKYSLNYIIGVPTGETADFTCPTSFRGVGFDYTHMLNSNVGIGVSASLQTFYDELGKVTTTSGTETITAYRFNYINSLPIYATGSYFFSNSKKLTPFVSLGIGAMYNNKQQDLGLYTLENDAWQFSVRPEAGLDYKINYGLSFRTAIRYNYAVESGDLEGLSHLALTLGVTWNN
ncbi:OmpW family outer membrane protein [Tamlana sp. 2_MG-2023]|nr:MULTISPECIES: OmpW family outer membrane protein [unclassified Tamlana]MDO6761447.1 OmpW family outer membrane protein [Tamlana sp. 2_MG-2023]MDO6792109.1 OmpW family outer membrane protein [Tamlana sp. 1_MG-2023]